MAKRGQVGGAVSRKGGGSGLARERRLRIVARSLLEAGGVGALDCDHVQVDARDAQATDGFAGLDALRKQARKSLDLPSNPVEVLDLAQVRPGRELALQLGELVLGLALLNRSVDGRYGLLPGQGGDDVRHHHQAGGDQCQGDDAKGSAHGVHDCGPGGASGRLRPIGACETWLSWPSIVWSAPPLMRQTPNSWGASCCCIPGALTPR